MSTVPERSSVILILAFLFGAFAAHAQRTEVSPYSRFGIGETQPSSLTNSLGRGGLSTPLPLRTSLNPSNPAGYSLLRKPSFEFGATTKHVEMSSEASKKTLSTTYLNHIALGFKVSERWGVGFGLLPYSTVGYNSERSFSLSNATNSRNIYEGSGGLRRVFFGTGVDLINIQDSTVLSFGVNGSYLFGKLESTRDAIYDGNAFNSRITQTHDIGDLHYEGGLMFQTYLGKQSDHRISAGFSSALPVDMNTERRLTAISYTGTGQDLSVVDTIQNTTNEKGLLKLPMELSGGVAWEYDERLLLGVQMDMQPWSEYDLRYNEISVADELKDVSHLRFGARYTPRSTIDATSSFLDMLHYRLGGKYSRTRLTVGGEQVKEIGMTFGLGIPLISSASASRIDLGAEFGKRGTTRDGGIEERYMKIQVAVSLSPHKANQWFYQKKYE